jgi:serine/threonine protein phosphatase PrpC
MLRVAEQYSGTDTGRQRRANEDALLARSPLFVVADGMGGAQAGEVASHVAVESFRAPLSVEDDPRLSLMARIQEANARIYELSRSNAEQAGMGTTLTALYVGATEVALAHVGDSRAYCMRDGQLTRLTHDHSLVDELIRQGRLTPAEAQDHPQRSVITRALGPEPTVEIDTLGYPGRDGDVYLICSDGLTTMVAEDQVAQILVHHPKLRDAGEGLLKAANEAGGRDNITVVLFRLEGVTGPQDSGLNQPTAQTTGGDALTDAGWAAVPAGSAPEQAPAADMEATAIVRPPNGVPAATTRRKFGAGWGTHATEAVTPLRPRQPSPQGRGSGRRRRWRPGPGLIVCTVALALLLGGAALAIQSVYFIGTNTRGFVTVFTGLPYQLPAGIKLYSSYYVSGVPAATVPATTRRELLDNSWRSESKVTQLVRSLELGQLAGQ